MPWALMPGFRKTNGSGIANWLVKSEGSACLNIVSAALVFRARLEFESGLAGAERRRAAGLAKVFGCFSFLRSEDTAGHQSAGELSRRGRANRGCQLSTRSVERSRSARERD